MEAWVTLATNDPYCLGALVLGRSLRKVDTNRQLHALVTPAVSDDLREQLSAVYDNVTVVNVLDSKDEANLAQIKRPELGVTYTKLHCWLLTQYQKCVFLDADCLVIQNCDELFQYPELSAAPDIGWPDIFNSGVFVFVPNRQTFDALLECALTKGSFDGGDQGLLNTFFDKWYSQGTSNRLPFVYNMSANAIYTYVAAWKKFAKDIKIVHFLGSVKPWHHSFDAERRTLHFRQESQTHYEYVNSWWTIFSDEILPKLNHQTLSAVTPAGSADQVDLLTRQPGQAAPSPSDEQARMAAWERGHIDYQGQDSWNNIQKHLQGNI